MSEKYQAEANLRLQAVASLPNLALFSDEAHHTYGREMGKRLKRVRQTVNYLHEKTNLIAVVNTTGTPYYGRQPLRDVVIWYGLSEGIRDGILKSLHGNIFAYDFEDQHTDQFVTEVVRDFFEHYGDVALPGGAPAKMAMYFPQTKDLREMRPVVERTLLEMGYPIDIVLRNTSNSPQAEVDAFNRLDHPDSRHRVILLVNRGTEGWDCPSLFACALARKLKRSKNFVLQASTRCLRQVPGNDHRARIYLSEENRGTLDRQLRETYGESVADLTRTQQQVTTSRIVLRKTKIPSLDISVNYQYVVAAEQAAEPHSLEKPQTEVAAVMVRKVFTPGEHPTPQAVLQQVDEVQAIFEPPGSDVYSAATQLATVYRLDVWAVLTELKRLYGAGGTVPQAHLKELASQIEERTRRYKIKEESRSVELALVKVEGFEKEPDDEGDVIYTAEITYQKHREHLLLSWEEMRDQNEADFGFHYDPYKFDANPEKDFFEQLLRVTNVSPDEVADVYFTGGLTDPKKTEFYVEYKGKDRKWHPYTPDFIVRRKDGRCYIVEIKAEDERDDPVNGERGLKAMAISQWTELNPETLKYQMVFADDEDVAWNTWKSIRQFIKER